MKWPVCILFLLSAYGLKAQHMPGAVMGNYAGTHILYHNPAFVSDTRYSVYANFASTNFAVGNNHVKYDFPYSFLGLITGTVSDTHLDDQGKLPLDRNRLVERLNGNLKYLNAEGDTRLPSLMVSLLGGRAGVAVTSRARYNLVIDQTQEPLARLIRSGTRNEKELHDVDFLGQSGKTLVNGLGEIGLTLGGVIVDNDTDFWKVGLTIKRMVGLYSGYINIKTADYQINSDPVWEHQRYMIDSKNVDADYGFVSDEAFKDFKPSPGWLFGKDSPGGGWGMDLGVVYEYRPDAHKYRYRQNGKSSLDPTQNKYLYRVAVSLTDFGRVKYQNPFYTSTYSIRGGNEVLNYDNYSNLKGVDNFFNAVQRSYGGEIQEGENQYSVSLPMAFQASVDYRLKFNTFVNVLWVQDLKSRGKFNNMHTGSMLAVTPRYEHRWYEISMPVSLLNNYRSVGIGLAGRLGPLWLGTDHLTALLNIGKPKSFTLYGGVSFGIGKKGPANSIACWPPKSSLFKKIFSNKR